MNPPTLYTSFEDVAQDLGFKLPTNPNTPARRSTSMSVSYLKKELAEHFNIGLGDRLSAENLEDNPLMFLEQLYDCAIALKRKLRDTEKREADLKEQIKTLSQKFQEQTHTASNLKAQLTENQARFKELKSALDQTQHSNKQQLKAIETDLMKREKDTHMRVHLQLQASGKNSFKLLDRPVRDANNGDTDFINEQRAIAWRQTEVVTNQMKTLWSFVIGLFGEVNSGFSLRKRFISQYFENSDPSFGSLEAIDRLCQIELDETGIFRTDDFNNLCKIFVDFMSFVDQFDASLSRNFREFLENVDPRRIGETSDALKSLFSSEKIAQFRDCAEATRFAKNFETVAEVQNDFLLTALQMAEGKSFDEMNNGLKVERKRPRIISIAHERTESIGVFLATQKTKLLNIKADRKQIQDDINGHVEELRTLSERKLSGIN